MVPLRPIPAGLVALIVLAGCSATAKGGFCAISQQIRPSAATIDAMTDAEVKAILAHNRKGRQLCGWRP